MQNAVDAAKAKRAGANDASAIATCQPMLVTQLLGSAKRTCKHLVDAAAKDGQVADKNALTADILSHDCFAISCYGINSTLSESTDAAKSVS